VIQFIAMRENLVGIRALLDATGGRLASVRPVAYERVLSRMTKSFWFDRAKESYWRLAGAAWPECRHELPSMLGSLAVRVARFARARSEFPRGVYIFADLDHLSAEWVRRAGVVARTLAESHPHNRLLNDPTRSMRRYELLRNLYEHGVNSFNVYRVTEGRWPDRYPVFLRYESDHGGPICGLLRNRQELSDAVRRFESAAWREDLLVVEFCDTGDTRGIYRKYGAFIIGDRVFPKSVQFSRHWVQKSPDLMDPELLREEADYVERNPDEKTLRDLFRLARIDYGRMDYTIAEGRIHVWEINTNPTIVRRRVIGADPRAVVRDLTLSRLVAAFEALSEVHAVSLPRLPDSGGDRRSRATGPLMRPNP
jgi:hypothetical protein